MSDPTTATSPTTTSPMWQADVLVGTAYLVALAAALAAGRAAGGHHAITAMFLFASVPMIDRRTAARRPGYTERMERVSAIVPWPRSRARSASTPTRR